MASLPKLARDVSGACLRGNVLRWYPPVSVPLRGILEKVNVVVSAYLTWIHVKPQLAQRIWLRVCSNAHSIRPGAILWANLYFASLVWVCWDVYTEGQPVTRLHVSC